MIIIDSNILIDIFSRDKDWTDWSTNALAKACDAGRIALNQIVVAEVAPQFPTLEEFLEWLEPFEPDYLDLTNDAAFCGGKAFRNYRSSRRKGHEGSKSVLADFLIGGHAQVLGATILTRDPRFYRIYFPSVRLISPDKPGQ